MRPTRAIRCRISIRHTQFDSIIEWHVCVNVCVCVYLWLLRVEGGRVVKSPLNLLDEYSKYVLTLTRTIQMLCTALKYPTHTYMKKKNELAAAVLANYELTIWLELILCVRDVFEWLVKYTENTHMSIRNIISTSFLLCSPNRTHLEQCRVHSTLSQTVVWYVLCQSYRGAYSAYDPERHTHREQSPHLIGGANAHPFASHTRVRFCRMTRENPSELSRARVKQWMGMPGKQPAAFSSVWCV